MHFPTLVTLAVALSACESSSPHGGGRDPATLAALSVRALGNELTHRIEDQVCMQFQDTAPKRAARGLLALQYHVPGGFEVRFRSLMLTPL